MKQIVVWWYKKKQTWVVTCRVCGRTFEFPVKDVAVGMARDFAWSHAKGETLPKSPCEVVIKNKNGRIGKGRSSRATYPRGADPRRSRG